MREASRRPKRLPVTTCALSVTRLRQQTQVAHLQLKRHFISSEGMSNYGFPVIKRVHFWTLQSNRLTNAWTEHETFQIRGGTINACKYFCTTRAQIIHVQIIMLMLLLEWTEHNMLFSGHGCSSALWLKTWKRKVFDILNSPIGH